MQESIVSACGLFWYFTEVYFLQPLATSAASRSQNEAVTAFSVAVTFGFKPIMPKTVARYWV